MLAHKSTICACICSLPHVIFGLSHEAYEVSAFLMSHGDPVDAFYISWHIVSPIRLIQVILMDPSKIMYPFVKNNSATGSMPLCMVYGLHKEPIPAASQAKLVGGGQPKVVIGYLVDPYIPLKWNRNTTTIVSTDWPQIP